MIYKPEDVLLNYNVPYDMKLKLCRYMNDMETGLVKISGNFEHFIEYVKFYFPNGYLKTKVYKYFCYFSRTDSFYANDCIDLSLENFYRIIKKDELEIGVFALKLKYICGLDDETKFIEYIKNFNNWQSDDWQLFVAERCE